MRVQKITPEHLVVLAQMGRDFTSAVKCAVQETNPLLTGSLRKIEAERVTKLLLRGVDPYPLYDHRCVEKIISFYGEDAIGDLHIPSCNCESQR